MVFLSSFLSDAPFFLAQAASTVDWGNAKCNLVRYSNLLGLKIHQIVELADREYTVVASPLLWTCT